MTTEVSIMNKHAVALAADSAVTISVSSQQSPKIFNSVDKLFKLSSHHPVAIMIYGSASFMRIPWETMIKEYRKKTGDRSEALLEDYASGFIDYLRSLDQRKGQQLNFVEQWHVAKFLGYFKERLLLSLAETANPAQQPPAGSDNPQEPAASQSEGQSGEPPVSKEDIAKFRKKVDETISLLSGHLDKLEQLDYMQGHQAAEMLAFNAQWVDQLWEDIFTSLPISPAQKKKILALVCDAVSRNYFFSQNDSGIVIAGFGEQQLYPVMVRCNFEGFLFGRLKYGGYEVSRINDEHRALVTPFAQGDEIYTFIQGIDPGFMNNISGCLTESARTQSRQLAEFLQGKGLKSEVVEEIVAATEQLAGAGQTEIETRLMDYARKKHIDPIVDAVAFLPKDELAHLAESLVTLTSVRKRMSTHAETVGGPVDVAIISKGDGFIWIKRKNYFNPELNRQLFRD